MKKNVRILTISLLTILILNVVMTTNVQASLSLSDMINSGKNFLTKGNKVDETIDENILKDASGNIYNTFKVIAIAIAIIVGIILGIQWMIASVEDKAKIKEMLIPYIVGCFVIFGSFTIWKTVVDFGQDVEGYTVPFEYGGGIVWTSSVNAIDFIKNGGDLTTVPDDTLLDWYGNLGRASQNNDGLKQYYDKVLAEVNRRGGYVKLNDELN